ncbi:hypothetical protein ACH42_04365 [Endozoicomonas sp. (ex Bugula neritina AB1)]|nr:hypothetical protein ACH42_04365 [Endozoicomonas sp. (ex Bugula neritina AB1)]
MFIFIRDVLYCGCNDKRDRLISAESTNDGRLRVYCPHSIYDVIGGTVYGYDAASSASDWRRPWGKNDNDRQAILTVFMVGLTIMQFSIAHCRTELAEGLLLP